MDFRFLAGGEKRNQELLWIVWFDIFSWPQSCLLKQWFLTLGYSGVFELQLPETPASTVGGEGFWELQSKTPE